MTQRSKKANLANHRAIQEMNFQLSSASVAAAQLSQRTVAQTDEIARQTDLAANTDANTIAALRTRMQATRISDADIIDKLRWICMNMQARPLAFWRLYVQKPLKRQLMRRGSHPSYAMVCCKSVLPTRRS